MSSAPRLTSRNLFDDVFASIPANIFLYTGPESLQEKYALMASRRIVAEEAEKAKEEGKDDMMNDGLFFESSNLPRNNGIMDVSAIMRHTAEVNEEKDQMVTASSFRNVLDIRLDAEDEAVQEATKYADLFTDVNEEGEYNTKEDEEDRTRADAGNKDISQVTSREKQQEQQQRDAVIPLSRQNLSAEEQIAIMQPEGGTQHKGRCVLFRHNKGFGFVTPDVGGPDVYFTRDNIEYYFTRRVLEVFYEERSVDMSKLEQVLQETTRGDDNTKNDDVSVIGVSSSIVAGNTASLDNNAEGEKEKIEATDGDGTGQKERIQNQEEEANTITSKVENEADNVTKSLVQQAAASLTPETARLLMLFLQLGKPTVCVPEAVTFKARWNRTGNRAGRRLRADEIRGLPCNGYALTVEQAWFDGVFSRVSGRYSEKGGCDITESDTGVCLPRYRGTICMYDAEELRGNIRPDGIGMQNVVFHSDAVLWDPLMDPARCRLSIGLLVRYSIASRGRNGKYIATLITATDDTAISDTNAEWATGKSAEDVDERQESDGVGGDRSGGGGGDKRDEDIKGRKRGRDEELLLLEEDGYDII